MFRVIKVKFYNCKICGQELEKHISKEGARFHVKWWDSKGVHCSCSSCEINHNCSKEETGRIDE